MRLKLSKVSSFFFPKRKWNSLVNVLWFSQIVTAASSRVKWSASRRTKELANFVAATSAVAGCCAAITNAPTFVTRDPAKRARWFRRTWRTVPAGKWNSKITRSILGKAVRTRSRLVVRPAGSDSRVDNQVSPSYKTADVFLAALKIFAPLEYLVKRKHGLLRV